MNATQNPTSSTLPPPAIQNQFLQHSMNKNGENYASAMARLKDYLLEEVDGDQSSAPLSAYCFMTGFIDAVAFPAIFIWCAFQTGNSLKLALALAHHSFDITDRLALCSVLTFIFGSFIGRFGDKLGSKTRLWLVLGTFIQTLFTMAATIAIWKNNEDSVARSPAYPAWTNGSSFVCIGFMSASMGLQAIMGKRVNTQFTTTVVLTSTLSVDIRHAVISRDHKIVAILGVFFGGFVGGVLIKSIGSAATLGIGTCIRLVISVWWLYVPEKQGRIRL
ncbi:hypothetical protein BDR07DRAFT_1425652 [Suillus spraguei]|nr:hypothetical protein BDR07DRAFT_1425652 [Suillus spraguei]